MPHNFVGHRGIFFFRSFNNQKNMNPYFLKLHNLHETVDDVLCEAIYKKIVEKITIINVA